MPIILNRLNRSVHMHFKTKQDGERIAKKRKPRTKKFITKSSSASIKIKTLINFQYELTKSKDFKGYNFLFCTITTNQHKTNFTDKELYHAFHKWKKNNKEFYYVCTVERQRPENFPKIYKDGSKQKPTKVFWEFKGHRGTFEQYGTNDLHFHFVVLYKKSFDFREEVRKLAKLMGTTEHPALFDCKRIKSNKRLVEYLSKYFTKKEAKVVDLFQCRTFSISNKLTRLFKTKFNKYVIKVPNYFKVVNSGLFKEKILTIENDFVKFYHWSIELWREAVKWSKVSNTNMFIPDFG